MSAMLSSSGTCRLISKGCNCVMYNRLHNRRTLSLGLTSLCQVAKKKRSLIHVNVFPVNKSSISMLSRSIGMLSPTLSTLFSTTATAVDHNTGGATKDDTTVFVRGYEFNHDTEYLKDLFIQFGDIRKISIPRKSNYDRLVSRPREIRYGFIHYHSADSARSAIQAATVTGPDDKIIEIKPTDKKGKDRIEESKRTFFVRGLPDGITIHQVHDHFKVFGDVLSINMYIKNSNAYVTYKKGADIQSLPNLDHDLAGTMVVVEKAQQASGQSRYKCRKILLSGIAEDITLEDIHNHFNAIGSTDEVRLFTDEDGVQRGMVGFNNKEDAISASKLDTHVIGSSHIKVHLLGILNE